MLPTQLTPDSFAAYPPEARRVAASRITLLRQLPLGFVPLLLRELIVYDWKFPAERADLDRQFTYLAGLPPEGLRGAMDSFSRLRLSPELERTDWVNSPASFSEQLTAHLWATHQIDGFRAAATAYVTKSSSAVPDGPLPAARLGIVVIGDAVAETRYRLFRKLRTQGTYYTKLSAGEGLKLLADAVSRRAAVHPIPYAHWCIDGGSSIPAGSDRATRVSYGDLSAVRAALQARMQKTYEASVFDPEAFRSMLARTKPEDLGFAATGDPVLSRFQLSLLTEGSGTQVFSTTFVQWAAREALRRAQPLTLLARFAARQREKPMNELLAETKRRPELDPEGSLVDADMGAYYTWINQQRLSDASNARFLVWFENHSEAVAIGNGFNRGERVDEPVELSALLSRLT